MQSELTTLDATSESSNQKTLGLAHRSLEGTSPKAQDQARNAVPDRTTKVPRKQRPLGSRQETGRKGDTQTPKTRATLQLVWQCSTRRTVSRGTRRSRAHWPETKQRSTSSKSSTRTETSSQISEVSTCTTPKPSQCLGKSTPADNRVRHKWPKAHQGSDQTSSLEKARTTLSKQGYF